MRREVRMIGAAGRVGRVRGKKRGMVIRRAEERLRKEGREVSVGNRGDEEIYILYGHAHIRLPIITCVCIC